MGIKIFYFFSLIYSLVAGLGLFKKNLPDKFLYLFLIIVGVGYLVYVFKKKNEFYDTIGAGIITNLAIQLTGGLKSPLYFLYFLMLPIIAYRDKYKNYLIITVVLLGIELFSGLFKQPISILPLLSLGAAILIFSIITKRVMGREIVLKKSLMKYETRDQFLAPADFEARTIITSIRDIDRHPAIERPLLYFVKFIHHIFAAHTTAVFAYNNNNLVLIQGFSRSELFLPEVVLDLKRGLYRQIIAEQKSVLIKEFTQDPEELGFYKGELKIASVIIGPVILLDRVEGLFVIDRKGEEFTEEDKDKFDEATKGLSFLLGMLRLYERERYEAQYLSSIAELARKLQRGLELKAILNDTTKSFKEVFKCNDISIAGVDELNNQGVVLESTYIRENRKFSLDDGLVGLVARYKNYILKDDLGQGNLVVLKKGERRRVGSFVGVPVKEDDEILGVIWLEDHRKKRFDEDDARRLDILSSQLTLAWQRAILYERVKEVSLRDGLTGLYNHRHFQEVLEQEINKQKELVLIFFDIDHFKKINDTYGHQTGDEVLKFLGRLISQTGIGARYGGEEFAIILPGHNLKKGIEIAVHLKDHLKKTEIKFNQTKIKITVSIGIAYYPKDAKTRITLLERADKALYKAKETGRDRIVIAQSLSQN